MSDALRADEFDLMLSTLRYVLGAGQAKNGEKARDHYNAIINSIASRAERTEAADVRFACEAVKRAALTAPPEPAVPLTADQHFALREAHAIGASDAYFKVWPIHDNDAGRMLFERGFVRGFDSHARLVERAAPQAAPQPTQDGKPAP